ncbi:hypothetical protein ACI78T_07755 [Blastococcus sp. SYSU D00922]
MKRTVRNGLAIAGMAGGIFFLGQAVASADQTASAGNNVDQGAASSSSEGSGSGAGNANFSEAEATNVQKTEVETDVEGGDGGVNVAVINTGVVNGYGGGGQVPLLVEPQPEPEDGKTVVDFESGDVAVHQSADGGDVNKSGNVSTDGNSGDQTATATNNVDQTASSEDEGEESEGSGAGNINGSSSEATNVDVTDIETDVEGGDGGKNVAIINTGIVGNTFYCPEGATCYYNFTTGSVTVHQSADGGDVNGSGNVNVGDSYGHPHADHHKPGAHHADCPEHKAAAPVAHHAKRAAPVHHRAAPVNTYAQPKGELAYTGAETTAPLALGLIALGAGGALTLAGRRRTSTATV